MLRAAEISTTNYFLKYFETMALTVVEKQLQKSFEPFLYLVQLFDSQKIEWLISSLIFI